MSQVARSNHTGPYSPLRYPGGKGRLAQFMRALINVNSINDGRYVEPYAGGAGIAWELLLTGVVRQASVNDISKPVFAFWHSVLNSTEELCRSINNCSITVPEWDRCRETVKRQEDDLLELGFAFFFLNRTNRSGILNGGIIGGREQSGPWKMDARFGKERLIRRIEKIADLRSKIQLTREDAIEFLQKRAPKWKKETTLVYIDPPYFEKGRYLYYDAYCSEDHRSLAETVSGFPSLQCVVSYDDVAPIHKLYEGWNWLRYNMHYTAQTKKVGREVLFFNKSLAVPDIPAPLVELDRRICN